MKSRSLSVIKIQTTCSEVSIQAVNCELDWRVRKAMELFHQTGLTGGFVAEVTVLLQRTCYL